jgi:NhaP-type Na+/H+ or K+/H+ antiporter
MKNEKQNTILMGVTSVCVVISLIVAGFVLHFNKVMQQAQEIQITAREMQRAQLERQLLFKELTEYAKAHPDLERLINQSAPAPRPAAK